jgi:undecaprenyl pyrophosphate phosphatase UppP
VAPFAVGAVASFASTLVATRLVRAMDEASSYVPFAAYRVVLGGAALAILRRR